MAGAEQAIRADPAADGLTQSEITLRFAPVRVLERPVESSALVDDSLATTLAPSPTTVSTSTLSPAAPALTTAARSEPRVATRPSRRLKGLDGLRALAVLAVVVFHLDYALLPGGFLGVDVFFVISGFLITYLLASEILTTGGLQLRAFYARRARRLLPAVAALLVFVTIAGTTIWRDQVPTLRGSVLSSLGYVTNWWLIADHQSYFVYTGRPPMLQHLWSLAIEEQFYLVWSVIVVCTVGLVFARGRAVDVERGIRRLVGVAGTLAVASAAAMSVIAEQNDLPYTGSVSRVYFGSDTHSMGLFLGAAGGAAFALRRRSGRGAARVRPRLLAVTDAIGFAAVLAIVYELSVTSEFRPGLYRGGFLAFSLLVLVAIRCAVRAGSLFARVLDMRPIRWVGQRSYSIYIWHWPIVVVTRPGLDVPGPVLLVNAARVALILAVSALSYRFVELPLRSGQWRGWLQARRKRPVRALEIVAVVAVLSIAGIFTAVGRPAGGWQPAAQHTSTRPSSGPDTSPSGGAPAVAPRHRQPTGAAAASGKSRSAAKTQHHATGTPVRRQVSAFGDSVLLGAGTALRDRTRLHLDAVEGRQAYDVLDDVLHAAAKHTLAPNVVIHIGNNGIIAPAQLRLTLQRLSTYRRVVLFTDRVARDWQDPNNATITSVGAQFANVRVVNWYALSAGHSSWLYPDGLHLTPVGAKHYTAIVLHALR